MSKQDEKPQSMLEGISKMPSPAETIKQGSLPESCLTWLDTAYEYAQKTSSANAEGDRVKIKEYNDIVKDCLKKIKEKVEAAR